MLPLIHAIAGRPWAIRADIATAVYGLVMRHGLAGLRHAADLKAAVHAYDESYNTKLAARRGERDSNGATVAIVQVMGTLTKNGDLVNSAQTLSTDAVGAAVESMVDDPKVDALVIRVDSPGGEVRGVTEAYAKIRAAAKLKPVVVAADGDMASAALWLVSGATEIYVTPSGGAGSVGVYGLHVDESEAMKTEGVKVTPIAADDSPFKTEGAPWEPLGDEAFAEMKKDVNRFMADFVRDVARGRGVSIEHVKKHFGKGRMLSPQEAVSVGMANSIGTLDQAIRRASDLGRAGRRESAARATSLAPNAMASRPVAGPSQAPNLGAGNDQRSCMNCEYFSKPTPDHDGGVCGRHDFHTMQMWMCDDWEARGETAPEDAPAAPEHDEMAAAADASRRAALARLRGL